MFDVALFQPEIPQNTGNIIRLCANTGCRLHLIQPFGFVWDDRRLKRAGLDYSALTRVQRHRDRSAFESALGDRRVWALSTSGGHRYDRVPYQPGDVLLFGPETRGLPPDLLDSHADDRILRIPMAKGSRSLNLANACAVVLYEALRQNGFEGLS